MWFKNLRVYALKEKMSIDQAMMESQLSSVKFIPCGAMEAESKGFVPPLGKLSDALLEVNAGNYLVCARFAKKLLPSSVVKEMTEERMEAFEAEHGRPAKGKEKTEIKDLVMQTLLPKAFSIHSDTYAWINPEAGLVYVDTSSDKKAEDVLALIRKAIGSLPAEPIRVNEHPPVVMTKWLVGDSMPAMLEAMNQISMISTKDEKRTVAIKGADLSEDDVLQHLRLDKIVDRLGLVFDATVSFTLDSGLNLRSIKFSDDITHPEEEADEDVLSRERANILIQVSEFGRLIPYIHGLFGGRKTE